MIRDFENLREEAHSDRAPDEPSPALREYSFKLQGKVR